MNLIPKINGNYDIFSSNRLALKGLNIIDKHNFFSKNTLDLINKKFDGFKKTNVILFPNKNNTYKITIINGDIVIETSKDLAYNSLITLFNLKEKLYNDMFLVDYPKYQHREFSIDVARHYFSIDELKKLIDEAANLKLNKIHLHLSDNQGWRIESKKYPRLNDIGGKDGYYTTFELKDIVKYAENRNIEIIPEIDIPSHVGAILASYPEFKCNEKTTELDRGYKNNDKTLCFGNPKTINFVTDIITEIMDIFPSKYIHIGCDEINLSHNKLCPKCKEYMHKKSYSSFNEVITYFINQIAKYIFENNREVIVWNDATRYGTLDERIIVQNWFDYPFDKTNQNEFNKNRRFIFGSTIHTYFDYPASLVTMENAYNFTPKINNNILAGNNILGTSSHIWTEIIDTNKKLEEKIFPRLVAFSESSWSNELDYNDFIIRLNYYLKKLEERNITYANPYDLTKKQQIDEIANYFKTFLNDNNSFSAYQTLIGAKLVLQLLSESKHLKDVPRLALKMLNK